MSKVEKKTVLFVCTGNSARSQMAEALLTHRAGNRFTAYSAGAHPEPVDPRTETALTSFGIPTEHLLSKHVNSFVKYSFDYVITLCDKANSECREYAHAQAQLSWDFPDPKVRDCNNPFAETLAEINNRITMFLQVNDEEAMQAQLVNHKPDDNEFVSLQPVAFYKTLTDDIRLKTLMLTHYHGELCVCELMTALAQESQPKVSRNLAVLKKSGVIIDRKHGQWVFYRINPNLPQWAKSVIAQTTENNISLIDDALYRLMQMNNRPNKVAFCK